MFPYADTPLNPWTALMDAGRRSTPLSAAVP